MSSERLPANPAWRAAIIGCGQIAGGYDEESGPGVVHTHVKAYHLHKDVDLVAVVDADRDRADHFAQRWAIPAVYTDTSEMIERERPEIVSICTPDPSHAQVLREVLAGQSVRAVWCEKPLAVDPKVAAELVAAYRRRGILLAVNYQRRWEPNLLAVGDAIRTGALGSIQKAVGYYTKGIRHNGSHLIDILLGWFGKPDDLRVLGHHIDFTPEDPTVDARLQFGPTPVYVLGVNERAYSLFEIDVIGSKGRVRIDQFGYRVTRSAVEADPLFPGYSALAAEGKSQQTDLSRAMQYALDDIVRAMADGEDVRSNGETALATLEVCHRLASLALEGT